MESGKLEKTARATVKRMLYIHSKYSENVNEENKFGELPYKIIHVYSKRGKEEFKYKS